MGTGTGTIIVGLIFIIISAIAKSIMDKLQFHYERSIFIKFKNQQFWNPEISWKNKWVSYKPKTFIGRFFNKFLFIHFIEY